MKEIRIRWWARGFYKATSKLHAFVMVNQDPQLPGALGRRNTRALCGYKLSRGFSSFSPDKPEKTAHPKATQCAHCLRLVPA